MIVTQRKTQAEILALIEGRQRLFLIGCGACAAVCKTGGEEQVFQLQEWLQDQGREVVDSLVLPEACHMLLAARELRRLKPQLEASEAVLVLACGAGVQSISEHLPQPVIGVLNTLFLGNVKRLGDYEERCSQCGQCILNDTAGICPVTRCAKGLLNGPCGGMEEGTCEADRSQTCAWHQIYEQLKAQGRSGIFGKVMPPKDWSLRQRPGRRNLRDDKE